MKELVKSQKDPKIKAKEFVKTIVDSQEYRDFNKYRKQLHGDQTAQNLLRKFKQKQIELQENGFNPSARKLSRRGGDIMSDDKIVRIFTMPQEFPCGPQSSCCGPIGQTEEEIRTLKDTVEEKLGLKVETLNVKNGKIMKKHRNILSMLRSFGWGVLPIFTLGGEVVCMGPTPDQIVNTLKEKME